MNRALRALRCLQRGQPVSRGTIQVEWEFVSFDEVRRLGLEESTELIMRKHFPDRGGILVAKTVLPEGTDTILFPKFNFIIKI